jgi:hypothetical protein
MKLSHVYAVMVGLLIAMGCVSCGSGGAGVDSGTPTPPSVAATTTEVDTDAIAAWYVKARQ